MRGIWFTLLWLFALLSNSTAFAQEGVFLWKSNGVYSAQAQQQLLRHTKQHDLERIYWGVTAEQARHPALFQARLGALMGQLKAQGVQSWLLLGDPGWITPDGREELLKLIGRFESLPFSGIMLDIEVEQLGFPVPDQRVDQWLDTLKSAVDKTGKPVEITAHWRWFLRGQTRCIVCELQKMGVNSASVMIYSTNIDRVREIAENAERPTGFQLRVAQSLEPFLPKEESWGQHSRAQRQQGINRLRQAVHYPLDWQAYEFIDSLE